MLLRGVPDLGVYDVVGSEVFGAFGGHSDQGVPLLHDGDRVGKRLEIPLERP